MKLLIFSHKLLWRSGKSPTGWATDGGFVFQIQALASSYTQTVLMVPSSKKRNESGEVWITDETIKIVPLAKPFGTGIFRKLLFPAWVLIHLPKFIYYTLKTDIVHAAIPGDIGSIGMIIAPLLGKKIFIRYCGNWQNRKTFAEKLWGWYGNTFAGKSIAFLCTGGSLIPPSQKNPALTWIFSSSMLEEDIKGMKRRQFDFRQEFNLVMGGRMAVEKGFGILIQAVSLVRQEIPHLKVYLFGDGVDKNIFEKQVAELQLLGTVNFLGKLNATQVHNALAMADIFLLPSFSEGFPKAVIEALAHSIPVICTPVSVLPKLVNDSENPAGLLVEQKNAEMLAKHILHYYHNPEIHLSHANNARKISTAYSLEKWVDTINDSLNKQWKTKLCRVRAIKK